MGKNPNDTQEGYRKGRQRNKNKAIQNAEKMISERPNNFVSHIHDEGYQQQYLGRILDSKGMIYNSVRQKESLSGNWNFAIDQYDSFLRAKWYEEKNTDDEGRNVPVDFDFNKWEAMRVPSCWNTEKEKCLFYEGCCIYTRKFMYDKNVDGRVFIKVGAANYEAKLFLNRKYLGMHKGGSTPFYVEVTKILEEENRIFITVDSTRKAENVPAKNTDWFNYGGLYRDVELIRVPETYIKDFGICLVPDGSFDKIKVEIEIDGSKDSGEAYVEIGELDVKITVPVSHGKGCSVIQARPELWSPENPKRYKVSVSFAKDSIDEMIGFREIRVHGIDILLNGKKIFLKGISAHEESVENGKAVTESEIIENFTLAKEMNCNYLRLAHYPHSEKAAQIADEMGIMLWEEIPVYWAIQFDNKETYDDAENQLVELIKRDRNRASVIIWSIGNENPDTGERFEFMSALAGKVKELDTTRLVSAACMLDHVNHVINDRISDVVDVIGINEYYGWYDPDFDNLIRLFENSKPDKPVVITEFGAGARKGVRGAKDEFFTEDCQMEIYKKQVETIRKIPYVKGISPWILFDFRCPRRLNAYQDYYNRKGLLSEDKLYKKPAFYVMKEFYAAIQPVDKA